MSEVLWHEPAARSGDALVAALRDALRGRVREAYVFGSHARGTATSESDIDLILVCDSEAPFVERARCFFDLQRTFGAMDILVYTPAEWLSVQDQGGYLAAMIQQRRKIL